jgi:hypothetical protein
VTEGGERYEEASSEGRANPAFSAEETASVQHCLFVYAPGAIHSATTNPLATNSL